VTPHVKGIEIRRWASAQTAECTLKSVLERFSEIPVEIGVDQRIQRRIKVSDPKDDRYYNIWAGAGFPTKRRADVP
jgi:hypothetical protein